MYKISRFLTVFLFVVLFLGVSVIAQETITLTTYYPSPLGVYDELGSNKLAVDLTGVAVDTEYAAMNDGDAHIGRALIIGAGGGSGFAYDEGASPGDGDVLIKGNVSIGITTIGANLRIYESSPTSDQILLQVGTNTDATRFTVDEDGDVGVDGTIDAASYSVGGTAGYNGDLRDSTGTKIATVTNGIITAVDF